MPLQRRVDLRGRKRGDPGLEVDVPGEGALQVEVRAQAVGERAVLGARHAPRLEQALLAGRDLLRTEAFAHRAAELLADGALHAVAVLRRENGADTEASRLVERARVKAG